MDATSTEPLPENVEKLISALDLRANSLIITIFGDAILPRGGAIWLGSLIALAARFGIGERLVRTGVYRLSQEGWLTSTAKGRKSYYSITPSGLEKFEAAQRRIYSAGPGAWDNDWCLVQLLPTMSQTERQTLRRELGWLGLGQISPTLLARPSAQGALIRQTIQELGLEAHVFVFRAAMEDWIDPTSVRDMAAQAWSLDALNTEYAEFVGHFKCFTESIEKNQISSPLVQFVLRILLIHDYRRILLKDPQLPDELLSNGWNGREARDLTAQLYRNLATSTERYLDDNMEIANESETAQSDVFWHRFGGLR